MEINPLYNFIPKFNKITPQERILLLDNGLNYCPHCKEVKSKDDFYKNKNNLSGLSNQCGQCLKLRSTTLREQNIDRVREIRRKSRFKNIEYYRKQSSDWKSNNREKVNTYKSTKYREDSNYKLTVLMRGLVRKLFKAIKLSKLDRTNNILNYSANDLKKHLESQFKEGMTWDNHGEWHIDHIKPISSAQTLGEAIELSQLKNLQPLWGIDNIKKEINFKF